MSKSAADIIALARKKGKRLPFLPQIQIVLVRFNSSLVETPVCLGPNHKIEGEVVKEW